MQARRERRMKKVYARRGRTRSIPVASVVYDPDKKDRNRMVKKTYSKRVVTTTK